MSTHTVLRATIPKQAALNIANAVSFYVQRLGFTELFQAEDYAGVRRDAVEIHLWLMTKTSPKEPPAASRWKTSSRSTQNISGKR